MVREALAKAEESAEMSDAPRGDGLRERSEQNLDAITKVQSLLTE
jgi:hypothetical protein